MRLNLNFILLFLITCFTACGQRPADDKVAGYYMSKKTGNMVFTNSKEEDIAEYPFTNITLDEDGKKYGAYVVGTYTKRGLMNDRAEMIIDTIYDYLGIVGENVLWAEKNKKYGFVDFSGKILVPIIYDSIDNTSTNGLFAADKNGKYGFINLKNEILIPFKFQDAKFFVDGLALVKLNNKYGYINTSGKEVIRCIYDEADSQFTEGLAPVMFQKRWGYINKEGEIIIPFLYDSATAFYKGIGQAYRKDEAKYYLFNNKGKLIKTSKSAAL